MLMICIRGFGIYCLPSASEFDFILYISWIQIEFRGQYNRLLALYVCICGYILWILVCCSLFIINVEITKMNWKNIQSVWRHYVYTYINFLFICWNACTYKFEFLQLLELDKTFVFPVSHNLQLTPAYLNEDFLLSLWSCPIPKFPIKFFLS